MSREYVQNATESILEHLENYVIIFSVAKAKHDQKLTAFATQQIFKTLLPY